MSQYITFEKVVPEGKALGRLEDGRAVFTIGPVPGEVARVGIRKQKKTYAEAVLHSIAKPSPYRSESAEDHCLICSPWQGIAYSHQCELKQEMLTEAFRQNHIQVDPTYEASDEVVGYRNRLDFTLDTAGDSPQLAFHQRGAWDTLIPLPRGCRLGSDRMNAAALNLTRQLSVFNITQPATITMRHARTTGELLTILTTNARADWKKLDAAELGNLVIARPLPGSGAIGASVFQANQSYITEVLAGLKISYPYNGFFQANTPVFQRSLEQITRLAEGAHRVIELYSGVGTIGLPIARSGTPVTGIETDPANTDFATRNAIANDIHSYSSITVAAEKMDAELLRHADVVILDPPRAGLHPRVITWLIEAKPKRIIYLSCNPITQARDIARLEPAYSLSDLIGYDFYPGTLHLETLACLDVR